MAGIANPGLLLRTCTTDIFNKIKDKSDTTLYFVTPDVNNDIAGVTNMQAVSLYRGENIIEDSNVIFVRDFNLPTYLDTDSETIYYRHHCMESHAQSLTNTITGAPGQKLYVLFIDSAPNSPTYNQIIDAFMYIWQTELSSIDSKQFTARIDSAEVAAPENTESDIRNWTTYDGVLDGVWTVHEILESTAPTADSLGTLTATLTCQDKKLGDSGLLKLRLKDIPSNINIVGDYDTKTDFEEEPYITLLNAAGAVDIVLKHSPVIPGTVVIKSQEPVKISDTETDFVEYTDEYENDCPTGSIKYNDVEYGKIDYATGVITITRNLFSGTTPTIFARKYMDKIQYTAGSGLLRLNITKTTNKIVDDLPVPDIFTLYIGHAMDAKPILEANHDVLTSKGCWLGFCIKNDTSDLFQIIDSLYYEVKHVENQIVDSYKSIKNHRDIYQETKIVYRTLEAKTADDGSAILDDTGNPILDEKARIIIDGTDGNLTIGSNTNVEFVANELLTNKVYNEDESPYLVFNGTSKHGSIVQDNFLITVYDLNHTPTEIHINAENPYYFRLAYTEGVAVTKETQLVDQSTVLNNYYFKLSNKPIAVDSVKLKISAKVKDTSTVDELSLTDDINGNLVLDDTPDIIYGTVDYTNGIIHVNKLLEAYDIDSLATIAYDTYTVQSNKATLVDTDNTYWGQVNLLTGEITGDLAEVIRTNANNGSPIDKVVADYSYTVTRDEADTLYLDITPETTKFYQQGTTEKDADGNLLREPATVTIEKDGDIYSASHYPNVTETYDIGSDSKRWNRAFVYLLDAKDLIRTPVLEITNIVPYRAQPNNIIYIGKRGEASDTIEAVNVNIDSSKEVAITSEQLITTTTKFIYRTADNISQINSSASGTELHAGIIRFTAVDGSIDSGDHRPNNDITYNLGTLEKRWKSIYSEEARLTNLYIDTIQSNSSDTINIKSDISTYNIYPQATDTYDVGSTDKSYNKLYVRTLHTDSITSNTAVEPIKIDDDLVVTGNTEVIGNSTLQSDLSVWGTATIEDSVIKTLKVTEDAKLVKTNTETNEETYRIGEEPASLVVIGQEGPLYRQENTLLGIKSGIVGDNTDDKESLTLWGVKNKLDYTAETLRQIIFVDFTVSPLPDYLVYEDEFGNITELSDTEAIIATCNNLNISPVESNIAIVKRTIATDTLDTPELDDDLVHYKHTGYVYSVAYDEDGIAWPKWQAMTGNYSAEDIYFTQDFKFTGPVGVISQKDIDANNGYVARRATGINVQDFLYNLFAKAKNPSVVQPTYKLTATPVVDVDNEVGNYITKVKWDGTFTPGSYEYGSINASDTSIRNTDTGTNITASYEMSNSVDTNTDTTLDGTFVLDTPVQIDSTSEKTYAQVTGVCKSSQSPRIPINNLHDPVNSLRIAAKDFNAIIANAKLTGHRKMFYGSSTSDIALTSGNVRSLQGKAISGTSSINVKIVADAKHVIVALPAGRKLLTLVNPDSKIDLMTVAGAVGTTTLVVEGANGFGAENTDDAMFYTIYEYKPAAALSENTYTATIGNV